MIEDVYIELLQDIYTNSAMTAIQSTDLETMYFRIDCEYLSHLRFANDIPICANTPHELQQMLQELADESGKQVLKKNKSKTKLIMEK